MATGRASVACFQRHEPRRLPAGRPASATATTRLGGPVALRPQGARQLLHRSRGRVDRRVDSQPSGAAPHRSERPQCGDRRLPSARPPSGTRRPPPHPTPPLAHRRPGCAAPHGARAELGAGLDTFLPVLGMKQELAVLASAAFAVISVVVNLWGNVLTEKKRAELQLEVSPPEGQTGRQAGARAGGEAGRQRG